MPITTSFDNERQLTIHTITGEITTEEMMTTVMQFYKNQPSLNALWDYGKGTMTSLPIGLMEEHLKEIKPIIVKREGGKTAYVGSSDANYGTARMLQVHSEINQLPFQVMAFRSYEDAIKWIDEE